MITILLIIILTIVLIFGSEILCSFIIGYMENRGEDELWIERYMDYIENKGKQLAEKRNRMVKMSRHYRKADVILQVFGNQRLAKDNGKLKPVDELVIEQKPLVYCEDCIHYNFETKGCKRNPSVEAWQKDDFCSYGEWRDEE